MKTIQIVVKKIYNFEVKNSLDLTNEDEIINAFEEYLSSNNILPSNELFDNVTLICSKCGVSLNLDEEIEDGMCVSCSNSKEVKQK